MMQWIVFCLCLFIFHPHDVHAFSLSPLPRMTSSHLLSTRLLRPISTQLQDKTSSSSSSSSSSSADSTTFDSSADYLHYLQSIATLPQGFAIGTTRFHFQPYEVANKQLPMNLTLLLLDKPTDVFACKFTKNHYCGGPIYIGRERLQSSSFLQAIIVNNKISNVCPNGLSDFGRGDSDQLCAEVAKLCDLPDKTYVLPSSTGIIGWRLPLESMVKALPQAVGNLQKKSILPAALGITTTDRYPKIRRYDSPEGWSIVGIAKGAGMIEPNMATMLTYILTDLTLPRNLLQDYLNDATDVSFNSISVDGDQSTSDTVVTLSSKMIPLSSDSKQQEMTLSSFKRELTHICQALSEDIVRNGEGIQHVIRITLKGFSSRHISPSLVKKIGKSIVNSNLVKCAISGNDPNVGRIVGAIGSCLSKECTSLEDTPFHPNDMTVLMGGITIFQAGCFDLTPDKEEALYQYLLSCQLYDNHLPEHDRNYPPHDRSVELEIIIGGGQNNNDDEGVTIIGGDLTKEYVEVNADYRS